MKMQVFLSTHFQSNLPKKAKVEEIPIMWITVPTYFCLRVDLPFHDLSDTLSPKMPEGRMISTVINTINDRTS